MSATTSHSRARTGPRYHRNDPYGFDELGLKFHRSAAGVAWRWRTELAITIAIAAGVWKLGHLITYTLAALTIAAIVLGLSGPPWTRRRFWCVLSRHRVHRLCWEARLHTRAGRLTLVLWTRPTKVGERLHVLCRAGVCADDFTDHTERLAAACYARDARVERHPRWAHLITIDIIRRDTLTAAHHVHSRLSARPAEPVPAPRLATFPKEPIP